MICKVTDAIEKFNLIDKDVKTVGVGFSGGADSVCLIDVLSSLKDTYGIIVKAIHINHNIRGAEADRDEQFVRDFCKKKNIELLVCNVDVPALAKERKISLEECGRQVRYDCFENSCCDAVAVAHTLSDSIETMLFNLARGTGAKGLTGISPRREPNIIRPLVYCTRKDIETYCNEHKLDYVTDSTNLLDDYTRNHIRHNIVPAFEKINSDFENSFLRAMNSIREEDDFICSCAMELLDKSRCEQGHKISVLSSADDAVVKKCILEILKEMMKKPPEARHVESVFSLIKAGKGKIELSKDLYIFANGDIISFSCAEVESFEWRTDFKDGVAQTPFGKIVLTENSEDGGEAFDADKIRDTLFVSSRLPGDRFTFVKRGVTKNLKKLFNELKIPAEKRNSVAVLHDGKNVVWIEDIGVNSMYIPGVNSQKIITIKKDG